MGKPLLTAALVFASLFSSSLAKASSPGIPLELIGRLGGSMHCAQEQPEYVSGIPRPYQHVSCNYTVQDLRVAITRLFDTEHSTLDVAYIEQLLKIPTMTTLYDDPRVADYETTLTGYGHWKVVLEVREGFWPSNQGAAKFVPGPRPIRILKKERGRLDVDFHIYTPINLVGGSGDCSIEHDYIIDLTNAGWKSQPQPLPSPHGSPPPSFDSGNGRTVTVIPAFASKFGSENLCMTQLLFSQKAPG